MSFWAASIASAALLLLCTAMFYEILAHVWVLLPRLMGKPRRQILFTVSATFLGHTLCIWIFGLAYYAFSLFDAGSLKGRENNHFFDYIYFSAVSYSSLGLGDVVPNGGLKLLVGVEAILGLVFIGWTVTFTYLVTQQYLFLRRKPKKDALH